MNKTVWLLVAGVSMVAMSCGDRCQGVTCSGHGDCFTSEGAPRCACDPAFAVSGLTCQPTQSTSPACVGTGGVCAANGECCSFRASDGFCVSGRCADACSANSQCNSGCCATLLSGARACSPAANCAATCRAVNSSCTRNGDCCNFAAGNGFCVDGFCADSCTANAECISGCCAPLAGGGKTCASRSFCP